MGGGSRGSPNRMGNNPSVQGASNNCNLGWAVCLFKAVSELRGRHAAEVCPLLFTRKSASPRAAHKAGWRAQLAGKSLKSWREEKARTKIAGLQTQHQTQRQHPISPPSLVCKAISWISSWAPPSALSEARSSPLHSSALWPIWGVQSSDLTSLYWTWGQVHHGPNFLWTCSRHVQPHSTNSCRCGWNWKCPHL